MKTHKCEMHELNANIKVANDYVYLSYDANSRI